jgi:hypothetical protein
MDVETLLVLAARNLAPRSSLIDASFCCCSGLSTPSRSLSYFCRTSENFWRFVCESSAGSLLMACISFTYASISGLTLVAWSSVRATSLRSRVSLA